MKKMENVIQINIYTFFTIKIFLSDKINKSFNRRYFIEINVYIIKARF